MTDLFLPLWPIARDLVTFIWWLLPASVQEVLLWQLIYLPLFLALRFVVAIQYARGGWWRLLTPLALRTGLLDVYLNYTTFSLLFMQLPARGEYTLSERCERLVLEPGWRGFVARMIARFTNMFDKNHILLP